jgi:preprotein translocase subunit SecD
MIATMVVGYGLLLVTILTGRSPTLGLDLQGGIAVNLQPVKDGQVTDDVTDEQLDQAIGIIRKRVDALGVAEPEVSRQGNTILVQLPGAENQQEVLELVGKTAELRFRPVLQEVGQTISDEDRPESEQKIADLRAELNVPEGVTASQVVEDEEAKQTAAAPQTAPAPEAPTTTVAASPPPTTAAPATTIDPTAGNGGSRSATARLQDATTTTVAPAPPTTAAAPTSTVPPTPLNQYGVNVYDPKFGELFQLESGLDAQTTPPAEDKADQEVTLSDGDGVLYRLGPTRLTGRAVETATAGLNEAGEWTVNPVFRKGEEGIDKFNQVATQCYNGDPVCPAGAGGRGRLAIVLDGDVLSAPSINEATFQRDQIQISGSFDEDSAKSLAVALRFGSLPIELQPQQAEVVSATLGQDALQAGLIAGGIGLGLVFVFLVLYYRLRLALISIGTLTLAASLLWVLMSSVGATLTLAGIVGIIVSIGIAVDSNIVFFETWKENVLNGATPRSSVERSFSAAWGTIVKADVASLIGAGVLYWLSVGPVRGFAFYLGAMTLLDLIMSYFFMYPASLALGRSARITPRRLGMPVDAEPAPSSGPGGDGADADGNDLADAADQLGVAGGRRP